MNVVFLDIDGVLATRSSYRAAGWSPGKGPEGLIVPDRAARVDELCRRVDASVVISSSWRQQHPLEDLTQWLREAGLSAPVLGATPVLPGRRRGEEIEAWVVAHGAKPEQFVILEDEEDVRPYRSRQVQTCFEGPRQGFLPKHLRQALRLFGVTP